MGLQGSKPIPALNNHGASADNKSLGSPKHLSEQASSQHLEMHSHLLLQLTWPDDGH